MADWREQASCSGTDPEAWFGDDSKLKFNAPTVLRRICGSCPVQAECLDWALRHEAYGFWGGLSSKQRERLRRDRGILFRAPEVEVFGRAG